MTAPSLADDLSPMGPRDFLSYQIIRLHHALNAQAIAILDSFGGLTLGQWRIIAMVGAGIAPTSRDLVRLSALDPAYISRTLRSLEIDGLAVTRRLERDRRTLEIELTDRGQDVFQQILPTMRARQRALLGALDAAEQDAIFRIIDKLALAAEQKDFAA